MHLLPQYDRTSLTRASWTYNMPPLASGATGKRGDDVPKCEPGLADGSAGGWGCFATPVRLEELGPICGAFWPVCVEYSRVVIERIRLR